MSIFFSLVIFGIALYLFFITNNKIKNIKENIIIQDSKKELEGLITEFNSAAARNIEILEDKIAELEQLLQKANQKMIQMDDKISRASHPIVIEKIVEKKKTEVKKEKPPIQREVPRKTKPVQVELSRSEKIRELIGQGKTKEELMVLGYMENEINLLSFLIRKNN
jgi:hypothetical protein